MNNDFERLKYYIQVIAADKFRKHNFEVMSTYWIGDPATLQEKLTLQYRNFNSIQYTNLDITLSFDQYGGMIPDEMFVETLAQVSDRIDNLIKKKELRDKITHICKEHIE